MMTGKQRLEVLREKLANFPLGLNFNMNHWGSLTEGLVEQLRKEGKTVPKNLTARCLTACCAAGFATTIPALQKEGLYLKGNPGGHLYPAWDGAVSKDGDGPDVDDALEQFFGLTNTQSYYIFIPDRYDEELTEEGLMKDDSPDHEAVTVRMVLKHVDEILAELEEAAAQ